VIYNNGKLSSENVLVQFREGAIDGPVVYSEVIPLIEKEGMIAVSTEINVSGWTPGNYKYFVTIDENAEIEEVDDTNNSDYFSIAVMPDLVIYAGDIVATLEEGIGGPVNVTVRNWGTYDASKVTVNLYEGPDIDLTKTPLQTWNISSLAVDGVTTLTTTVDHIPYNLFAVVDPDNIYEEIEESNNVAFEDLPIVHGSNVTVVGASDPNLDDIIYTPAEFDESTGVFEVPAEANLYDVSTIIEAPQLCDISLLTEFTELQGKIALVEKSSLCTYTTQVNNAGLLGAVAVLVYNNIDGGNTREVMTGLPVTIPAGFLPRQDGLDLILFRDQLIRIASLSEAVTMLDPYR
jgi:subtilase family serine protease